MESKSTLTLPIIFPPTLASSILFAIGTQPLCPPGTPTLLAAVPLTTVTGAAQPKHLSAPHAHNFAQLQDHRRGSTLRFSVEPRWTDDSQCEINILMFLWNPCPARSTPKGFGDGCLQTLPYLNEQQVYHRSRIREPHSPTTKPHPHLVWGGSQLPLLEELIA